MKRWRTSTQLPVIMNALGRSEEDPATRTLTEAFGGDPVAIREQAIGEPAYRSRRLSFASGGDIILHDGAVVAVILNLAPTLSAPHGVNLPAWIAQQRRSHQ